LLICLEKHRGQAAFKALFGRLLALTFGSLLDHPQVVAAMNAIESQRRMRMAAQEKAEGDKILVVKVRLVNTVSSNSPFDLPCFSRSNDEKDGQWIGRRG